MFATMEPFLATAVQRPPVFLDLNKSVDKASDLIAEAAQAGAELIVFPETWLPGYPIWLDVAPGAGLWDYEPATAVFRRLFQNSVEIGGTAVSPSTSPDIMPAPMCSSSRWMRNRTSMFARCRE